MASTQTTSPIPTQHGSFWHANWDKIIPIMIALGGVIVGGVVGFFMAVSAVGNNVHEVSSRVTALEIEAEKVWRPKTVKVDELRRDLEKLDQLVNPDYS